MKNKYSLTSKSQVIVPKKIRNYLDLKPKDYIGYEINDRGVSFYKVKTYTAEEGRGLLAEFAKNTTPVTDEDMRSAIIESVVEKYERKNKL